MFRKFAGVAAAAAITLASGAAFAADNFPSRPIHLIVPYPAGGIVDLVGRTLTDRISRDWNQSIIVEAKPGANSDIGTALAARSAPDGYTWIITGPALLVNPTFYKDAAWDPIRDFKCVGVAVWNQSVAVVPKALGVTTMKQFIDLAKSKPGQLNFGNPGVGSSIDLTARNLFAAADIKLTNVGYKGQPPALLDLMSNQVQFEIVSLALAMPQIKSGAIVPLAVFTQDRVKTLPDTPTIAEAGYPGAAYTPLYGIYAPAKTPEPVLKSINEAINKALAAPDVIERLSRADIPGKPMSLEALAGLMKEDHEKLTAVVKASGVKQQ